MNEPFSDEFKAQVENAHRHLFAFPEGSTRTHTFVVTACGGDAELICVLQKVMERFTTPILNSKEYIDPLPFGPVNAEAVAEWFYAKYGPKG